MSAGWLLVVEGLYGAGKSTFVRTVHDAAATRGLVTTAIEWNSTAIGRAGVEMKCAGALGADALLLVELADLAVTLRSIVTPVLRAGGLCVADRYVYSAMTRALVRGADPAWVRAVVDFAPAPTRVVYLDVPVDVCVQRRTSDVRPWSGYVSGEDFLPGDLAPRARFTRYLQLLADRYREVLPGDRTLRVRSADAGRALASSLVDEFAAPGGRLRQNG